MRINLFVRSLYKLSVTPPLPAVKHYFNEFVQPLYLTSACSRGRTRP
jgi:hypothetical protein